MASTLNIHGGAIAHAGTNTYDDENYRSVVHLRGGRDAITLAVFIDDDKLLQSAHALEDAAEALREAYRRQAAAELNRRDTHDR